MAYHSNGYSGDEREMSRSDDRIQDEMDKPTYLMEHLATFTVNKETGITYPADGMRRLLQLEKTNGIWSQKMQLCLDRSWVLIMDYETGTIMERFPAKSVIEPTAFTSQDPMEMYNNILVFIVTNSNPQHPPEMHIFQCQSISAQDLVEDLKEIQKGRILTRNRRTSIPPPSMKPPPQHVNTSRDYRESDSELTTNNDDNSSTTSEQYERDVTVLNHCFDDIEKFIARLQHAAAASRELERRRRSRKSKKSDNGDGMLTMRTKPPLEKEFVDIFQKFKLSFNLLAKLKAHIHDPNAPELVHFLFTPLALIVEAAHDTYFDLHIPHNVVSPLLTREAINLLINCVTSKETELWHSLGNAWLIPRNEWKGHVSTYHPVFLDKWSPDYPVVDELEPNKHYRDPHNEGQYSDDEYDPSMQDNMFMMENQRGESHHDSEPKMDHREHSGHEMASGARSDISADSIERNGGMGSGMSGPPDERSFKRLQENFLLMLQKQNALIVQVTYPRTANNDKELTVVRGEYLEVLDDTRKWWRARNHKGEIAHVPHTIVSRYNGQSDIYPNPIYRESASDRLSPSGPDHPPPAPPAPADLVRRERQGGAGNVIKICVGFAPPAPAPPPPPSVDYNNSMRVPSAASLQNVQLRPTNAQPARPKSARNGLWAAANVNDELSAIFQLMEDKKRNDIDIKPTPGVYISAKSSPDDVQEWLRAKKFEGEIITTLKGKNGKEMFKLAQQPSELFNSPDGKRLQSQLKLQMSVCGYQTVRVSEFKQILERARNRADTSM